MKIGDIINNIDNEALALPVFQRGFVWKPRQVKELMNSLYRGYPVGSLLTWTTRTGQVDIRGNTERNSGPIDLLLDGQQRITSLYGLRRGKPPAFFDGDASAFTGLYFNLKTEEFEFLAPARANADPLWVSVTRIFSDRGASLLAELATNPDHAANLSEYMPRVVNLTQVMETDLPIQQITGDDKTTDIVVDIFNRVNSGGTTLSKGDLALARIGARWPAARTEMQQRLNKWKSAGFDASLDWLLRCMNTIITESSELDRLEPERVGRETFQGSLQKTENAVDHLLEAMRSHLFMDVDRVYNSKQAFPVMVKYLVDNGGRFPNRATMARLFHWYISVAIWGRFSGPVETVINQDLLGLASSSPIESLLRNLRLSQGERSVAPENFDLGYTRARFYPMLYVMSRIRDARDWGTGNRLRQHSLGDHTNLELHHIFPKAYLRRNKIPGKDANNMGNIAFQTRETNRAIGNKPPAEYMPQVAANWPGVLESQWIPMDPELWQAENYHRFLDERRKLLAKSANEMLAMLQAGEMPLPESPSHIAQGPQVSDVTPMETGIDPDDEAAILSEANRIATENGFPVGEMAYEVYGKNTEEPIATLDLAWPEGLQTGYTRPVALLIDEDDAVLRVVGNTDFKVFTSLDDFRRYVEEDVLAEGD